MHVVRNPWGQNIVNTSKTIHLMFWNYYLFKFLILYTIYILFLIFHSFIQGWRYSSWLWHSVASQLQLLSVLLLQLQMPDVYQQMRAKTSVLLEVWLKLPPNLHLTSEERRKGNFFIFIFPFHPLLNTSMSHFARIKGKTCYKLQQSSVCIVFVASIF